MDEKRNMAFRRPPSRDIGDSYPRPGPGISGYIQYLTLGITYPVKSVNNNMGIEKSRGESFRCVHLSAWQYWQPVLASFLR